MLDIDIAYIVDQYEQALPKDKYAFMFGLANWMQTQSYHLPESQAQCLDRFLIRRLAQRDIEEIYGELLVVVRQRLLSNVDLANWGGIITFLEALHYHLTIDSNSNVCQQIHRLLDELSAENAMHKLIYPDTINVDDFPTMRQVTGLLKPTVLQPLLNTLKYSGSINDRLRAVRILQQIGSVHRPLLLAELRSNHPWYVIRNLLQILADAGDDTTMDAVRECAMHDDPRVRMEAMTATARLAGANAEAVLLHGLEDKDENVRARTASLANYCATPAICAKLLTLLKKPLFGKGEAECVRFAACLALGHFRAADVRSALLQVLFPSPLSPYRTNSELIRSAAVSALAPHREDPDVCEALRRAQHDPSPLVRQAAARVSFENPAVA